MMSSQRLHPRQAGAQSAVTRRLATAGLLRPALVLLLALPVGVLAQSAVNVAASTEINALLDSVAKSGCEFRRNGSWYDGSAAQGHLRDKYRYFVNKQQIATTEQFIERAATRSEMSGLAYEMRCHGGANLPLSNWLHDQLAQQRAAVK